MTPRHHRFRRGVAMLAPFAADCVGKLREWMDVKLLTVRVDRLPQWYLQGLLCLGDAAQAMPPIGGVGINLTIQDAIAAANLLAAPLRERGLTPRHLQRVRRRRELPTWITQGLQILIQRRVITQVLAGGVRLDPPLPIRLLARFSVLRRLPARMIGMSIRPEHVKTPAVPVAPRG